jgi:hypothetical protein
MYSALSVKKHWLTVAMLAGPPMSQTLNSIDSTYLSNKTQQGGILETKRGSKPHQEKLITLVGSGGACL